MEMNQVQRDYITAKAIYDTRHEYVLAEFKQLPSFPRGATDKQIEERVNQEVSIENKYGLNDARLLLSKMTNNLIDWASDTMREIKPNEYHMIADAFIKGRRNPLFRDKLIDICLRFNPGS